MKELLKVDEKRRLDVAVFLFHQDDWITLAELSQELNRPARSLRYDLKSLKDSFPAFTMESSHHGVRLSFHRDKSLTTLYRNISVRSSSPTL